MASQVDAARGGGLDGAPVGALTEMETAGAGGIGDRIEIYFGSKMAKDTFGGGGTANVSGADEQNAQSGNLPMLPDGFARHRIRL